MPTSMSKLLFPPPSDASAATSSTRRAGPLHRFLAAPAYPRFATGASSETTGLAGERDGLPFVKISSGILRAELTSLLKDDEAPAYCANSPLLVDVEFRTLEEKGETPAYPDAMSALFAACLAGNVTEQLWNFTWPAAIATLHPSLLPVAVLGFFTKLVVFAAGPLVGDLVTSLPRIPAYRSLAAIQTAAHLVSAATITYAFTLPRAASAAALLWFAVLVASTAVDRLSCVSLGVIAERDFVVQLASRGGQAGGAGAGERDAQQSRPHLRDGRCVHLCCPAVPERPADLHQALLRHLALRAAASDFPGRGDESERSEHGSTRAASAFSIRSKAEEAMATIRRGWREYVRQPVLPASLAYVLVCFNVALAPGALMTTFLIHHGVSPSVLGTFGGSSAAMGILATFATPHLVKELGILKAGAAGLITQSLLLGAAVLVFLAAGGPAAVSRHGGALFVFLGLIVASRVGHMAYSVIGLQVVQTGNPAGKAKLIGATEIAVASLAELAMMAVAVLARDARHYGILAALSAASVTAAACLFCAWMAQPNEELERLFPS
ncbi:hypothetical protein EJB05_34109, partial [Eragrostis curvula]